ncbi:MAG TPA: hypothetical protein VK081_13320 [Planctomycetota bacterium]|nr:hypothetical protein [Planctomycetota bacterium]
MSRKLLLALLAFLLAAITAWAEPGGEGGCVNLPGGRTAQTPSGVNGRFTTSVLENNGVTFVLPDDMGIAVAMIRGNDVPFVFFKGSVDGSLHVPGEMLATMRAANIGGFVIDLIDGTGYYLCVRVSLDAGSMLTVVVD